MLGERSALGLTCKKKRTQLILCARFAAGRKHAQDWKWRITKWIEKYIFSGICTVAYSLVMTCTSFIQMKKYISTLETHAFWIYNNTLVLLNIKLHHVFFSFTWVKLNPCYDSRVFPISATTFKYFYPSTLFEYFCRYIIDDFIKLDGVQIL